MINFGSKAGWRVLATAAFLASTACATQPVPVSEAPLPPPEAAPAAVDPNSWPAVQSRVAIDPAQEARIDAILAKMTIEEKVAQLIQPDINSVTPEDVRKYKFGSILAGGNSS